MLKKNPTGIMVSNTLIPAYFPEFRRISQSVKKLCEKIAFKSNLI